jgi:GntR family transcriptional regulator
MTTTTGETPTIDSALQAGSGNDTTPAVSGSSPIAKLESSLLAERARAAILDAILQRRFEGRLPTEARLAKMLNVSRTTIRAALQPLERDGFITRRRAIGTTINAHVSPRTLALQRLVDWEWFLRLATDGRQARREVEWDQRQVPQTFVDAFGLPATDRCVHMERTYRLDELAVLHSRAIVPERNLNERTIADPFPDLIIDFSELYCRKPIDHSVARINAVACAAEGECSSRLGLPTGNAFIRPHETLYATDAEIVGYGILDIDDRLLELEIFRRRDR